MAERLGLPVFVDNDANLAALAEHRAGAARGASEAVMLTIGTGIGGGLILRGELYRGAVGAAAELGHMVIDMDGPRCQGNCPNHGCVEVAGLGHRAGPRGGPARRRAAPTPALGRALADGQALLGPLVTELAHDGDDGGDRGDRADRHPARRRRSASFVNIFNPEVVVIGGGVIAAGELLLAPARAEVAPSGRCRRRATWSGSSPAHFGVEAGMVGAAALALRRPARRARMSRPADRLPDADRQPRGRHPARAGRAARGRRRRLRGHAPHARAARPLRRQRARWSATTSTTSASAPASWSRGCARGRSWRWSPTPACRWSPTPASCSCAACVAAGLAVEVLPGPSAALAALVASALPADRWRFAGFLPRKRAELVDGALGSPETLVAFESPRRVAASLAVLAELDPARPVAVCRELTKLHEEVVRGTAAELAARYARRRRRGARWCS